jgi:hypothetical protein
MLPSDASVIAEGESGVRYPRWMRGLGGLSRGGALGMLLDPWPTGAYQEFVLHGHGAILTRQAEALQNYRLEVDGTVIGGTDKIFARNDQLDHVFAITAPDFADAEIRGANAIVIRTIPGTNIRRGFAVTINSPSEARIYNDGIAGGWSSERINSAIQAVRRTESYDGSFRIGQMRYTSGTAFVSGPALANADANWLSNGSGAVPRQVAERLNGQRFSSFDSFREAFWMTVADTPDLIGGFSRGNLGRMRNGLAPIAHRDGWHGSQNQMVIHHQNEIRHGGPVYDMSNMQIVSPRQHHWIHYGR